MGNYLKVDRRQQVIALLELGWSYRRIQSETGVRRETVSRYDKLRRSKAAKVFPGSKPLPPRSSAAVYHDEIMGKLEEHLSAKRIWQDLVEDFGYGYAYESVKRYVRTLKSQHRVVTVLHSAPGEEAQVDCFQGVPTFDSRTGQWKRPWVFRMTLSCSRCGYEEAVWNQKLETFLRLHERAFEALGGVPSIVRHDNLKAAAVRACLYDPDMNETYVAFSEHWGFTPLATKPRRPQENGKQERSGGYVKDNALKGKRFDSLQELNEYLKRWNRTIARLRIHGTTRKQVWTYFLETDKPALKPIASERFAMFDTGTRSVHPDGHVEVAGAFYPVSPRLLGQKVQVRWDDKLVRVYHSDALVASHPELRPVTTHRRRDKKPSRRPSRCSPPSYWGDANVSEHPFAPGPARRTRYEGLGLCGSSKACSASLASNRAKACCGPPTKPLNTACSATRTSNASSNAVIPPGLLSSLFSQNTRTSVPWTLIEWRIGHEPTTQHPTTSSSSLRHRRGSADTTRTSKERGARASRVPRVTRPRRARTRRRPVVQTQTQTSNHCSDQGALRFRLDVQSEDSPCPALRARPPPDSLPSTRTSSSSALPVSESRTPPSRSPSARSAPATAFSCVPFSISPKTSPRPTPLVSGASS